MHQFRDFVYQTGSKNVDGKSYESYSVSNVSGFVRQDEQFKKGGMVSQADKNKSIIVEPKSFAYNPARLDVGSIGYQNLSNKVLISPMYVVFKAKNEIVLDEFLWQYFKSRKFNRIVLSNQEGGVRTCFNFDKLKNTKIYLPDSLGEQNKIINFLKNLDELSETLHLNLQTLKKYKKGLQKALFYSKNYKYAKLKKVASFQQKSKYGANAGISSGAYPFYLSGEKISSLNNYMYEGIYIIANDGGEANFRITNGRFSYSDHCICLKGFDDYKTKFIFNYLESIKEKITYAGFVGSGLKNIDRDYFENLPIPICDDLTTKSYSGLFSIIDEMINKHDSQLASLKKLKLYLLSNMFI